MFQETFEKFMERCLHDPQKGYYSQNIRSIGSRGDFTTAPQLSDAPAKAIAAWAAQALRSSKTRNLIEIGPGLGTLSKQVLNHLPFTLRLRTKLHLVESSLTLSNHQKAQLGKKASYHKDIFSALRSCDGNAVIFSNELVDAFAARLFQKTEKDWLEIALDHSSNQTKEILIKPAQLPDSSIFKRDFPTGQRVEIHNSYHQWLQTWLPHWKRGELLTIDYGDISKNLYHRQPLGTVRGYLLHQLTQGQQIYQNQGLQDLTADVNFTDLIEWCEPWLESKEPETLVDFIRPFCSEKDSNLLSAGNYFLVLQQTRK